MADELDRPTIAEWRTLIEWNREEAGREAWPNPSMSRMHSARADEIEAMLGRAVHG